ncbi:MAG: anthranilate synthase component I family protein [Sandaracinus sp.]|nr:anthranilate synthase component I family protein [Sandaracinus sp.]MCB9631717.1 anthranilate synthase component I family protein [Sandaracinus sp.]
MLRERLDGRWDAARVVAQARAWRARDGLVWLDGDGSVAGRWSWIACEPVEVVEVPVGVDALAAWERFESSETWTDPDVPRWIGWMGYDALWAGALDGRSPRHPPCRRHEGTALRFTRHDWIVGIDHDAHEAWLFAESTDARSRFELVRDDHDGPVEASIRDVEVTDAAAHAAAIERAREAIARGELYQVNLARCWSGRIVGDSLALALAMREASPVPLGLYARTETGAVVGRSMERFLSWDRQVLETRPIKGTLARRGDDAAEAEHLLADVKERAEHAMIVDLLRNDLARVAKVGGVKVVDPLRVEPYAGLHHLVTTVRAETRPEVGLREVLAATFPPGSITGAPKVAAVECIEREEPFARGVYCGAYGFVSRSGRLSLAVAIRTAVIEGNHVRYFAGGGIVWPSDAEREVAETELKARVFSDAVAKLG